MSVTRPAVRMISRAAEAYSIVCIRDAETAGQEGDTHFEETEQTDEGGGLSPGRRVKASRPVQPRSWIASMIHMEEGGSRVRPVARTGKGE